MKTILAVAAVLIVIALIIVTIIRGRDRRLSQGEFRDIVLTRAHALFPNGSVEASQDSLEVVVMNGIHIGLQNLRRKYELSDKSAGVLDELILAHFSLAPADAAEGDQLPAYEDIKGRILPQLMLIEYVDRVPLCYRPFSASVVLGYVIDEPTEYKYITSEQVSEWGLSEEDIFSVATSNLHDRSRGIETHTSSNEATRFIVIEEQDGYDAARIIVPQLRSFIGERLGFPFHFGIPNRDFLICWSASSEKKFQDFTTGKIAKDFAEQPYSLSPSVFEVNEAGEINELIFPENSY